MAISSDLRISELLAARLCHELVGPITRCRNGGRSSCATTAPGVRSGGAGAGRRKRAARQPAGCNSIALPMVLRRRPGRRGRRRIELAADYFQGHAILCRYGDERPSRLPLSTAKARLQSLLIGAEALGRGGTCLKAVALRRSGLDWKLTGDGASLTREQSAALTLADTSRGSEFAHRARVFYRLCSRGRKAGGSSEARRLDGFTDLGCPRRLGCSTTAPRLRGRQSPSPRLTATGGSAGSRNT